MRAVGPVHRDARPAPRLPLCGLGQRGRRRLARAPWPAPAGGPIPRGDRRRRRLRALDGGACGSPHACRGHGARSPLSGSCPPPCVTWCTGWWRATAIAGSGGMTRARRSTPRSGRDCCRRTGPRAGRRHVQCAHVAPSPCRCLPIVVALMTTCAWNLHAATRIPVRVERHAPGAPLTFGLPLPKGLLRSPDRVRVLDAAGHEVPSQVTAVTTRGSAHLQPQVDLAVLLRRPVGSLHGGSR